MYDLTDDLEVKANAVVSAAELGRSHNRWYVMRKVVGMANNDISSDLAFRICIEISINNRNKSNFIRCVEMIRWSINNYHDIIREALMPVV